MACAKVEIAAEQDAPTSGRIVDSPSKSLEQQAPLLVERRFFNHKTHMQFELVRLSTFRGWPSPHLQPAALASQGFSYCSTKDLVQCQFCHAVIGYWVEGDTAAEEHAKYGPSCPMVQGHAVGNVPLGGAGRVLSNILSAVLNNPSQYPTATSFAAKKGIKFDGKPKVQHPSYADFKKRLATFSETAVKFPDHSKMAAAGFYLLGLGDRTACYSCGGGVMNWSVGEVPAEVHRKLYPKCPLSQEEDWEMLDADSQQQDFQNNTSNFKRLSVNLDDKKVILGLPIAKKLMEFGYDGKLVTDCLWYHFERNLGIPESIREALDVLEDYEDSFLS